MIWRMRDLMGGIAGAAAVATMVMVSAAEAQEDNVGIADACTSCHGIGGHSQGYIPSLAGVDKSTLLSMLKGFKAQQGNATIMNRIARGYSDAELEALADYFSAVKTK
jgi:sulfide dehydrogenase cytochrome subunit